LMACKADEKNLASLLGTVDSPVNQSFQLTCILTEVI